MLQMREGKNIVRQRVNLDLSFKVAYHSSCLSLLCLYYLPDYLSVLCYWIPISVLCWHHSYYTVHANFYFAIVIRRCVQNLKIITSGILALSARILC
jgi:hypothetical protein